MRALPLSIRPRVFLYWFSGPIVTVLLALALVFPAAAHSQIASTDNTQQVTFSRQQAFHLLQQTCRQWSRRQGPAESWLPPDARVVSPDQRSGREDATRSSASFSYQWASASANGLRLDADPERGRFSLQLGHRRPWFLLVLGERCEIIQARQILYNAAAKPYKVLILDSDLNSTSRYEWVNPSLGVTPAKHLPSTDSTVAGRRRPAEGKPVRVALVDSGVNYLLPDIRDGLALDSAGKLLGYDFWDMDSLPFDAHPARSAFFNSRHGTRTASIVLREAPGVQLVPYRYPRPDLSLIHI